MDAWSRIGPLGQHGAHVAKMHQTLRLVNHSGKWGLVRGARVSKIDPITDQNGKSWQENGGDPEIDLLIPDDDVADPEVSIVVPAVNEELTISEFVDWCQQGLRLAQRAWRSTHRRQLDRPHRRVGSRWRGSSTENTETGPWTRLYRRRLAYPRTVCVDGRR